MTSNQIKYWELQETIRSNKAREQELHRANLAQEAINFGTLGENVRHNIQVEGINKGELSEKVRHNVATEGEILRSNMMNESLKRDSNSIERSRVTLGYAQLSETARANKQKEALEQERVNNETFGIITNRHIQERNQALQLANVRNEADKVLVQQRQADIAAQRQAAEERHWRTMDAQGWTKTALEGAETLLDTGVKIQNQIGRYNYGPLFK